MLTVVSFLVLLGVLIFIHEFGHFIVAKRCGVKVLNFSLGFGPKLFSKTVGETEYAISLLPLGGYVRLFGEDEKEIVSEEEKQRSFSYQPLKVRFAIVFAGPMFNFLLAVLIFAVVYIVGIPTLSATIGEVVAGSPAQSADIRSGDRITNINGVAIQSWDEIVKIMSVTDGKAMAITIARNESKSPNGSVILQKNIVPIEQSVKHVFGEETKTYKLGVTSSQNLFIKKMNPLSAVGEALNKVWEISKLTVVGIIKIFEGVISPTKSLGGPIFIAQMAGAQAKAGLLPFVLLMAVLSINLGILNLFPIPALDGGHLAFYVVEAIIGKPISPKVREVAQQIGFALLIALMVFVVFIDIDRANFGIVNDVKQWIMSK